MIRVCGLYSLGLCQIFSEEKRTVEQTTQCRPFLVMSRVAANNQMADQDDWFCLVAEVCSQREGSLYIVPKDLGAVLREMACNAVFADDAVAIKKLHSVRKAYKTKR